MRFSISLKNLVSRLALGSVVVSLSLQLPGVALAQSSSNSAPVPTQAAVTVNQASTQSVISVVSSSVQASLAQATMSSIRMPQPSNGVLPSGISSGDVAGLAGSAWSTGDYVGLRVNPDGNTDQRRLSDIYSLVAGGDIKVLDSVAVGLAGAFTFAETDGHNVNMTSVDQRMRTYTITPYIGWSITDHLMVDALVGYSYSDIATKDFKSGSLVSSSTGAHTVFSAVNASYFIPIDSFTLKPFAGFSGQSSRTAAYVDSQNNGTTGNHSVHWLARVGAQLSYPINDTLSTYVSAAYERDRHQKGIGESSARLSAGLEGALTKDLTLAVEATSNVGRETQSDYGGSANLRFAF
jgi:outer membrane autotransporter protein